MRIDGSLPLNNEILQDFMDCHARVLLGITAV